MDNTIKILKDLICIPSFVDDKHIEDKIRDIAKKIKIKITDLNFKFYLNLSI